MPTVSDCRRSSFFSRTSLHVPPHRPRRLLESAVSLADASTASLSSMAHDMHSSSETARNTIDRFAGGHALLDLPRGREPVHNPYTALQACGIVPVTSVF